MNGRRHGDEGAIPFVVVGVVALGGVLGLAWAGQEWAQSLLREAGGELTVWVLRGAFWALDLVALQSAAAPVSRDWDTPVLEGPAVPIYALAALVMVATLIAEVIAGMATGNTARIVQAIFRALVAGMLASAGGALLLAIGGALSDLGRIALEASGTSVDAPLVPPQEVLMDSALQRDTGVELFVVFLAGLVIVFTSLGIYFTLAMRPVLLAAVIVFLPVAHALSVWTPMRRTQVRAWSLAFAVLLADAAILTMFAVTNTVMGQPQGVDRLIFATSEPYKSWSTTPPPRRTASESTCHKGMPRSADSPDRKVIRMELQSLTCLRAADDRALRFAPLGLSTGGSLDPEFVARYQQEVIADVNLGAEVPEATRLAFERLRRLHSHGVLLYDAYTIASEQAPFVLDLALRERFVAFYRSDGVPLVNGARRQTLAITSYADFTQRDLPKANRELREMPGDGKRWKLEWLPGRRMEFSGSFKHLLLWARNVSLLHGQRNRAIEKAIGRLRNHAAHPEGCVLEGPVQSARMIWDVAEMINRLWEADATGRRLYPEPVRREVMAVGWAGDDGSIVSFHADPHHKNPDDARTYVLLRAVHDDPDLFQYSSKYEKTLYPADLLFGPATWPEAREWLLANNPTADAVNYLDRLFAVRERDGQVDLPRRPSVAAALPEDERSGTWHLLRADHPNWAYAHVRGAGGTPKKSCAQSGPCRNCQVEVLDRGSWQKVVAVQGFDPVRPADIEVPSMGLA